MNARLIHKSLKKQINTLFIQDSKSINNYMQELF